MNIREEIAVPQTISIPFSTRVALIEVARKRGVRISEIIRSGIEKELKSLERKAAKDNP